MFLCLLRLVHASFWCGDEGFASSFRPVRCWVGVILVLSGFFVLVRSSFVSVAGCSLGLMWGYFCLFWGVFSFNRCFSAVFWFGDSFHFFDRPS